LENKDRSIFRKNIGRAILARASDPFATDWEVDLTTRSSRQKNTHLVVSDRRREVERDVTRCMQSHFSFAVFGVNDKEQRLSLESKLISTVSRCPICEPSPGWLGLNSPKAKIRESGLWLVNELYKEPFSELEAESFGRLLKEEHEKRFLESF
jgi:hypothetical protein